MPDSLKKKTVKGVRWSFLDTISNQGVTFIVGIVLARHLSPREYGLIGIITIFISVSNTIVDSGFSNALIRKKDANDTDYSTGFYTNLGISLLVYLLLYIGAPYISVFFNELELTVLLRVMGVIVIINALSIIQRTLLVKKIDFKTQAYVSLTASLTSGVIGIYLVFTGHGVWALIYQQVSRQSIRTLLLWIANRWFPQLTFSRRSFKELWSFGSKLLTSSIISITWNEIYQVVIGKFYSTATLGLYTRANQFSTICSSYLTTIVQRVSYPALSSIQDDRLRLKSAYQRVIRVTMFPAFVLMAGMAACAKPMILTLIGEQWVECVPMLQIICSFMVLYPLHAINLNMLQVQGRSDLFLKLEIIKKFISVGPLILGIFVGIYWMLVGSFFSNIACYYLNAYYSGLHLHYGIKEQVKDLLPSLGIALVMAVPVGIMTFLPIPHSLLLLLQVVVGGSIVVTICEHTKLPEYMELKNILLPTLKKLLFFSSKKR